LTHNTPIRYYSLSRGAICVDGSRKSHSRWIVFNAAGEVGEFKYGEGEYVHPTPVSIKLKLARGLNHWRNWLPKVYYCTHAIAPLMYITGRRPVKVNAFSVPYDANDPVRQLHVARSDSAGMIVCRTDNGTLFKALQGELPGHNTCVRIHGNRGLMETNRQRSGGLRIWHEPWENPEEPARERIYEPVFPPEHEAATAAGHGGGDYFTNYHFARAIRSGEPPFLDIYRALDMTLCGIQAWRSILNDSAAMEVPDLRDEAVRKRYENDHWSPAPDAPPEFRLPSSVLGQIAPSPEAVAYAEKIWSEEKRKEAGAQDEKEV